MSSTIQNIQSVKNILMQDGIDPEQYFPSCVGCGFCCLQATCSLGVHFFNNRHPCLALNWNGEQYRCQLAEEYKDELYIGSGCCSPLNDWRKEVKQRDL